MFDPQLLLSAASNAGPKRNDSAAEGGYASSGGVRAGVTADSSLDSSGWSVQFGSGVNLGTGGGGVMPWLIGAALIAGALWLIKRKA